MNTRTAKPRWLGIKTGDYLSSINVNQLVVAGLKCLIGEHVKRRDRVDKQGLIITCLFYDDDIGMDIA